MQNYCSILFCQADPLHVPQLYISGLVTVCMFKIPVSGDEQFQRGCLILETRKPASFWVDIILITDADGVTPTYISLLDVSLVCEVSLN